MTNLYDVNLDVTKPRELGGGEWKIRNLTSITVLFGKNGSGKSKLLRQWRSQNAAEYHYVVPERAGEIDYQANHLADQLRSEGRLSQTQRNFSGEYRRQIVARISAYFAARGDHRGSALPTHPDELEALIAPLLPDFELRLSGTKVPPYDLKRLTDGKPIDNIDQLSSGETQVLTLALDILTMAGIWDIQNTPRRIMLIDEPDAHIHPDLQVRFADFLVQIAGRFKIQIITATHSTTLLAAIGQFAQEQAGVLYLDRTENLLTAQPFTQLLRELSACLGGHALMGPLFGQPLLLVEGDDDYRIWSQVPRYHYANFSVIPGGGDEIKKYQASLEQVFSALRSEETSSSAFALIDGDKNKPIANSERPQNHVRYIQLACHESENLYLTDEVLELLGTNWTDAKRAILEAAPAYGQREAQLVKIAKSDRQNADLKGAMEALTAILDGKNVLWTLRVAKALGTERPSGQIAIFLGHEVIVALWGTASDREPEEFATAD